jgi:hypothetical protein
MNEQEVRDWIDGRSVTHARGTYRVSRIALQPDRLHSDTADLFFQATSDDSGDRIGFRLHLSEDSANATAADLTAFEAHRTRRRS